MASPRPRANSATPRVKQGPPTPQPGSSAIPRSNLPKRNYKPDSGSELEREYGKRLIAGRLVVANAEVVPSSSESEREIQAQRQRSHIPGPSSTDKRKTVYAAGPSRTASPRLASISPQPAPEVSSSSWRSHLGLRKGSSKIGLGFDVYPGRQPSRDTQPSEDEESVYEQDVADPQGSARYQDSRSPRVHSRRQHDEASAQDYFDDDQERYGPPSDDERRNDDLVSSSARKRREALVGLVNGLHFDDPQPRSGGRKGKGQQNSSPAMHDENHSRIQTYPDPELENRRQNYDTETSRKSKPKTRQRSNTQHVPSCQAPSAPEMHQSSSSTRDHRRSVSVPSRSRPSSRNLDTVSSSTRPSSPRQDVYEEPPEQPSGSRKSRRRTSAGQTNEKRRSVAEEIVEPAPTPKRPSNSRRQSHHLREPAAGIALERRQDTAHREREAFGIPESLSYGGHEAPRDASANRYDAGPSRKGYDEQDHDSQIPSSARSSPDAERWEEQTDPAVFSPAAQALLSQLSGTKDGGRHSQSSRPSSSRRSSTGTSKSRASLAHSRSQSTHHAPQQPARPPLVNSVSASSSMPPVYEPEPDVDQHAQPPLENSRSWRSFIASATYSTLRSHYGDMEMQRQEVIYQFHGAQQELVQQLGAIVRVFVLPLRRRHSKAWLPGVPKEVSRLFDWLEDIMNLHTSLAETLDSVTSAWSTGEIVIRFSQAIRGFVPRLEIYQPYLVRVDAIQKMLSESAATQGDEFGEFVRLRETHEECGGWTLSELLQRPIDYLTASIESYKVRILATY